jgi:hypothetical protein
VADELGTWSPLSLPEVAQLLAGIREPWWIAGGLAIELFVGRPTRSHDDVDVQICRDDQLAFQAALATWDLHAADPPGTLRPWHRGESLPLTVQDIWCRPNPTAPWAFQFMLADTLADQWIFRRDRRVRRSLAALTHRSIDGLPYIAPEVQLLFKARATPRPKDEHDFAIAHGLLSEEARAWLDAALALYNPDHPWRKRL